jgi:hypothetical protein
VDHLALFVTEAGPGCQQFVCALFDWLLEDYLDVLLV